MGASVCTYKIPTLLLSCKLRARARQICQRHRAGMRRPCIARDPSGKAKAGIDWDKINLSTVLKDNQALLAKNARADCAAVMKWLAARTAKERELSADRWQVVRHCQAGKK